MEKKVLFECDMSVRLFRCLHAADLYTFEDVMKEGSKNLLKFRNFGLKSLSELTEVLKQNGYTLI